MPIFWSFLKLLMESRNDVLESGGYFLTPDLDVYVEQMVSNIENRPKIHNLDQGQRNSLALRKQPRYHGIMIDATVRR